MADLVKSISEIFSNRSFRIPDYQRGYAWKKEKQLVDFWQDLELLPNNRDHFTGTLVLKPAPFPNNEWIDRQGEDHHIFDVIDGQQRLTTIIILLKAIHHEMEIIGEDPDLIKGIKEKYLYCEDSNRITMTLLTPNRDSREFFCSQILMDHYDPKGEINRAVKNMEEAKIFFLEKLAAKRNELGVAYPTWLGQLRLKMTRQLKLIVYEVANELEAGTIFETMNDRGKPITELDKVKNYFLYVCSKLDSPDPVRLTLSEKINSTWTSIFEDLMAARISDDENEDQLLRVHWLMMYDYNPNNWQKSRSIKEKFSLKAYAGKHDKLREDLDQYLETLQNTVTGYCDLQKPESSNAFNEIKDDNVRREIQVASAKLSRLGARASFQPLLIAVRLKGGLDGRAYKQVVELCENFDFRVYEWSRHQPRAGQSTLFKLGYEFFHNVNLPALLNGIKETLWYYCPDLRFLQKFDLEAENWYAWSGIKYFLYEYEEHLADQKGVSVRMPWEDLIQSRKENTIEHILPQTPVDKYWTSRFPTKEEQVMWINDIGNLTLTYDNSPMQNKPFRKGKVDHDDKVSYYEDSTILIEQTLKEEKEWDRNAIQRRRDRLKGWAIERWNVEPPSGGWDKGNDTDESISKLPVEEKKVIYYQRFLDDADRLGNGAEFRSLLEIAKKFPLYLYLNPKYDAPTFNLLNHRTTTMLWIGPDLYIYINQSDFDTRFGLEDGTCASIVGEEKRRLTREEVPDFIECLKQLLQKIQSQATDL
ncbi:MAG: DUF262 domain-containing HNH endonuclease family protein [Anaerolineaceae bacterium]|nr:DUF262 domain-containing HNH endonuclease family protein [Anaerolineaceae bacterium]